MGSETRITDLCGHQSASRRVAEVAQRQFGAVARWQLRLHGLSEARIRSFLRTRRLHPWYPGVYAYGRPDLSTRGGLAAALLYAGPGAALGGLTALWWLELLNRRPALIHIDAPGRKASRQNILIRHPDAVPRTRHRGLPLVPIERALLRATDSLSPDSLRLVLARAEFRKLISLQALNLAASEGRRGSRALRAAMDAHLPQLAHCANGLERDFVLLCERHRLALPEPNARIGRYRPDMLWRGAMVIVELDGTQAHSTPAQLLADARRQAELERRGYLVIRFSREQVRRRPGWVAAGVRAALA